MGDGINDSIALKKANVSISLRGASTIATDTAHIVFLEEGLAKLCELRDISRDLDLNVERAAHALGMSSSALSRLARQRGTSLPQIILTHKLDGAQRNIERFGTVRDVGWIARRWGFADSDQLRRLLREANTVTADDWPPV